MGHRARQRRRGRHTAHPDLLAGRLGRQPGPVDQRLRGRQRRRAGRGAHLVGSDRAVRVLHLRHRHDPELREPARRLRRRELELWLPRRHVGPQRRRRRLRHRRHQRVPERVPAGYLWHHRHVQLRQRHFVQRVQPGASGRAWRCPVRRVPGVPGLERAADLRAADRRRARGDREHPAVLLLRRRLRQRDELRQQPGHVLPARQAVQRHHHRRRRLVPGTHADVRQPGPRLRREAGAGVDRAAGQHPARREGGELDLALLAGPARRRRRGLLHPRRHREGHRRLPHLHRLATHPEGPVGHVPATAGRRLHRLLPGLRQHKRRQPE